MDDIGSCSMGIVPGFSTCQFVLKWQHWKTGQPWGSLPVFLISGPDHNACHADKGAGVWSCQKNMISISPEL